MKYSLVADIMFVAPGEHGPIWPDEAGLCKAMDLAKSNGLQGIELFDFEGRDLDLLAAEAKKRDMEIVSFCQKNGKFWGDPAHLDEFVQGFKDSVEAAKKLGTPNLIVSDDFALLQDNNSVRGMEDIFETVLCDDDIRSQLQVDLPYSVQEIRSGNRIQLARRLIENECVRLHRHDGRQI